MVKIVFKNWRVQELRRPIVIFLPLCLFSAYIFGALVVIVLQYLCIFPYALSAFVFSLLLLLLALFSGLSTVQLDF